MTVEEAISKLTRKEIARGLSVALNLRLRIEVMRNLPPDADHGYKTINEILRKRKDEWLVEP